MKKTVLYLVEGPGNAQFRYQLMNIIEALQGSSTWRVKWVLVEQATEADFRGVDFVVISRQIAKGNTIPKLIQKAHAMGVKVFFALDDLIFDYRDLFILSKGTGGGKIFFWLKYIWAVRKTAKKVDGFVTTNGFLSKKLERTFHKPCVIIPNSLNKAQIELSEKCLVKKVRHPEFTIGYFSGSPTHRKDFKMVEKEILRFLDNHAGTKLKLVGIMDLSSAIKRRIKTGQIEIMGMLDYLEQIKVTAAVDVNIAPLVVNAFTNCKSELKFFEAAVVETITLASPSYSFKNAIQNGETGFLVETGEWYDKLEFLYLHPETSQKIARSARKYAIENYYGEKFLKEVELAYNDLAS